MQNLHTEIHELPQSSDPINLWVENVTQGQLDEILTNINSDISLIFVSVASFNAVWKYPFRADRIVSSQFRVSPHSIVPCKMVELERSDMQYVSTELYEAIDLPFGNGELSCIFVLPASGTSISKLVEYLCDPLN